MKFRLFLTAVLVLASLIALAIGAAQPAIPSNPFDRYVSRLGEYADCGNPYYCQEGPISFYVSNFNVLSVFIPKLSQEIPIGNLAFWYESWEYRKGVYTFRSGELTVRVPGNSLRDPIRSIQFTERVSGK